MSVVTICPKQLSDRIQAGEQIVLQLSIERTISVVVDFARSPANAWNSGESHYK